MFTGLLFPRLVNVVIFNVCCVHLISWGCLSWHTLTQHLFYWAAVFGILQFSNALLHYLLLPISFESTINSSNATLALCSLFISITLVIYFVASCICCSFHMGCSFSWFPALLVPLQCFYIHTSPVMHSVSLFPYVF